MSRYYTGRKNPLLYVVGLLLVMSFIVGLGAVLMRQDSSGFSTAYEGAKATFYGVNRDGYHVEGTSAFRGTTMNYDPDDPGIWAPNIEGEMTSVFIPATSIYSSIPSWVPQSWSNGLRYINNPLETYDWTIPADKSPDGMVHSYRMEKWITKWYVSFEAGFDTNGIWKEYEGNSQRIKGMEVWFKLDTQPSWYFEGAEKTYFTVAKVECANVLKQGHIVDWIDVTPEASGSDLYLYYQPYGQPLNVGDDTFKGYAVGEVLLNPAYFRDVLYTMVRLDDFGTQGYLDGLAYKNQGDVVTYEFTVHQFVVGEWIVQDIQDVPDDYERDGKTTTDGIPVTDWIRDFLATPTGVLTVTFIVMIIVVILILMVLGNPVVSTIILGSLGYRNQQRPPT